MTRSPFLDTDIDFRDTDAATHPDAADHLAETVRAYFAIRHGSDAEQERRRAAFKVAQPDDVQEAIDRERAAIRAALLAAIDGARRSVVAAD